MNRGRPITVLYAEDDEDDRKLTVDALQASRLANDLRTVRDGEELMDYLLRRGTYADPATSPAPDIILLDLNMPRKSGQEALREIKASPGLRHIPVIVLTTSKTEEDIFRSYDLGASSYVTKPVTFSSMIRILDEIGRYWFEIVELPSDRGPPR